MRKVDYLIVGQGLAGTLMAHELIKAGQEVLVMDQGHKDTASEIAAGIINPITGRSFVKTWMFDELRPVYQATYRELEKLLGVSIFHEKNLLRVLMDAQEVNTWSSKTALDHIQPHVVHAPTLAEFENKVKKGVGLSELQQSAQLHISVLITAFRAYLAQNDRLVEEAFDHSALVIEERSIQYKNIAADNLLFCEGHRGYDNPFFLYLPYRIAKGEVLFCNIPSLSTQRLLKHKLMLAPLPPSYGPNRYWLGANYDKKPEHDQPTPEGFQWLEAKKQAMLQIPHSVIAHKAANRPTTRDRRPILGQHRRYAPLFIFNGLGAKGSSVGPYWAKVMLDFLLHQKTLPKEVYLYR